MPIKYIMGHLTWFDWVRQMTIEQELERHALAAKAVAQARADKATSRGKQFGMWDDKSTTRASRRQLALFDAHYRRKRIRNRMAEQLRTQNERT